MRSLRRGGIRRTPAWRRNGHRPNLLAQLARAQARWPANVSLRPERRTPLQHPHIGRHTHCRCRHSVRQRGPVPVDVPSRRTNRSTRRDLDHGVLLSHALWVGRPRSRRLGRGCPAPLVPFPPPRIAPAKLRCIRPSWLDLGWRSRSWSPARSRSTLRDCV